MNPRRRRTLVIFGLFCAVVIIAGVLFCRIKQYSFRIHTQHTIDEMQHLEIGTSNTCQVFSDWRKEWGPAVSHEGTCDGPDPFSMSLRVQYPANLWPTICFKGQANRAIHLLVRGMCSAYETLFGKVFLFSAYLQGKGGTVAARSVIVFAPAPYDENWKDFRGTIFALATAPAQLVDPRGRGRGRDEQSDIRQRSLHPSYRVFVSKARANEDYEPQGLIFYIEAEIGSEVKWSDSERLFAIDLSCLTEFRSCSRQSLMPAAYEQYEMDERTSQAPPQR